MKILNTFVTITKVPLPDKPKTKVYMWQFDLNTRGFLMRFGGHSTTMNGATNDASIVLYDEIKKGNLL